MKERIIGSIWLAILFIALIISIKVTKGYRLPNFQGQIHKETNWMLYSEVDNSNKVTKLPTTLSYESNLKYRLSTKLSYSPNDTESPYAFLSMNHMYFKVYLDGNEIYSYTKEDTPNFSKSPGNAYAIVSLPKDCYGKEFCIDFWLTLEDGIVYEVFDVLFGDYPTIMQHAFYQNLSRNVINFYILIYGILLTLFSVSILDKHISRDAWYIGIFAIVFGTYNLTENQFNLYMISNPYITYLINFIVFASIPIPILLFFKGNVNPVFKKAYNVLVTLLWINIGVQTLLNFSRIKDYRQLLIFTHIFDLAAVILIVISILKTSTSYLTNKNCLMCSFIPIIIGAILDAFIHYTKISEPGSNTFFLQLGVTIFLTLIALNVFKNVTNTYKEKIKGDFYKELAYRDGLTKILNRAAFNKELEEIYMNNTNVHNIIIVSVDLNNLKQVNDLIGHYSGDNMICKTAVLLKKYFKDYGKVFRTGGDEFVLLLYNISIETFKEQLDDLHTEIDELNKHSEFKINFALGYEECNQINQANIEQCLKDADKKMYLNKTTLKELGK